MLYKNSTVSKTAFIVAGAKIALEETKIRHYSHDIVVGNCKNALKLLLMEEQHQN